MVNQAKVFEEYKKKKTDKKYEAMFYQRIQVNGDPKY